MLSMISLIKVVVFIYIYVRLFILETMSKHRSALKCLVDMFRIVLYYKCKNIYGTLYLINIKNFSFLKFRENNCTFKIPFGSSKLMSIVCF